MGLNVNFPRLEPWQQPVFDDFKAGTYDIQTVKAKRQVGKSILAETCVLFKAIGQGGSISVIIEPTLSQSRRIYKQLLKSIGGESCPILKSANATLLEIELKNGSSIIFKSAEQREALRGLTVTGVLVIDEAAFIQQDIFEILYPTLDANHAPLILISTPLFQSGEFWEKYNEGLDTTQRISKSYNWSSYDTSKYLSEEKLEYYRQRLSPLRFRSEYEGEFIAEGSLAMGNINGVIADYSDRASIYGGMDWGNGGENDYTALILLDEEAAVTVLEYKNNLTPTEQITYFSSIINAHHPKAIEVEINSIGTVYYDFLRKEVSSDTYIAQFITSNESKRRIIEQLISAIQRREITLPDDPELKFQLQHYDIQKTKTGYTYNGVGSHDDLTITLALAYDAYLNSLGNFEIAFV